MKQISRKITHWQQNLPHHLESTLFDRNLLRRGDAYDKPLFWVLLCLLCFGLVMVYSASGVQAGLYHFDNRASLLIKPTQFALIGGASGVRAGRYNSTTPHSFLINQPQFALSAVLRVIC